MTFLKTKLPFDSYQARRVAAGQLLLISGAGLTSVPIIERGSMEAVYYFGEHGHNIIPVTFSVG